MEDTFKFTLRVCTTFHIHATLNQEDVVEYVLNSHRGFGEKDSEEADEHESNIDYG